MFAKATNGNLSTIMGLVAVVLASALGIGVDVATLVSQRSAMTTSLEAGLLAAAREAPVVGWSEESVFGIVDTYVEENLRDTASGKTDYKLQVTVDPSTGKVSGRLEQHSHGYFVLGLLKKDPQIVTEAAAVVVSSANTCVLALHPNNGSTLKMSGKSNITGNNCGIFANSTDVKAVEIEAKSKITAVAVCSAGGADFTPGDITPAVQTDCPVQPDPLAERAPPSFGACTHKDTEIKGTDTINPGVYCGGIKISGNAVVTAKPGVYIIKDGELSIAGNATLNGTGVGFFLTGDASTINFDVSTTIALSAPNSGPLAGILFYEDRNAPEGNKHVIGSKDARELVGAIYLPNSTLEVSKTQEFAGGSAWTAIIARQILADNGADLHFNSDYSATSVPVPGGLAGGKQVRLVE